MTRRGASFAAMVFCRCNRRSAGQVCPWGTMRRPGLELPMRNLDLREKVRQKVVPGALLVAWICVASYTVSALLAMSGAWDAARARPSDRKSTRLNSSHGYISYAVFCLKKKTNER